METEYKTCREQYASDIKKFFICKGTRVVFADELWKYIVFPYRIQHKKLRGFPNIEKWKDIIIFLPTKKKVRLKKLKCKYRNIDNQIYIPEDLFNSHWQNIEKCLNLCIQNTHTYGLNEAKDIVDLRWYTKYDSVAIMQDGKISVHAKEHTEEEKKMHSRRASIMDNPRIIYAYRVGDSVIHDKNCEIVSQITDEQFLGSESIPDGMIMCKKCKYMNLIRQGCGDDFKHYSAYELFFRKKGKVSVEDMRLYIEENKGKFRVLDKNVMEMTCNEDVWRIERKEDGELVIFHNNYLVISENKRFICDGFHIQDIKTLSLTSLIRYIRKYQWNIEHNKSYFFNKEEISHFNEDKFNEILEQKDSEE